MPGSGQIKCTWRSGVSFIPDPHSKVGRDRLSAKAQTCLRGVSVESFDLRDSTTLAKNKHNKNCSPCRFSNIQFNLGINWNLGYTELCLLCFHAVWFNRSIMLHLTSSKSSVPTHRILFVSPFTCFFEKNPLLEVLFHLLQYLERLQSIESILNQYWINIESILNQSNLLFLFVSTFFPCLPWGFSNVANASPRSEAIFAASDLVPVRLVASWCKLRRKKQKYVLNWSYYNLNDVFETLSAFTFA